MEVSYLTNVLIVTALSAAVLYLCHLAKIPVIIGFLITGMLAGPQGLELMADVKAVELLAETGIILLLFTLGIEFSFQNLVIYRKVALLGGSLQVVLTAAAAALISSYAGLPVPESICIQIGQGRHPAPERRIAGLPLPEPDPRSVLARHELHAEGK